MRNKKLTVREFVALYDIVKNPDYFEDELSRDIAILCVLTGKPEDHFLKMQLKELNELRRTITVLSLEDIKPVAKPMLKANGKHYAPVYDFTKLTAGQFVDVNEFAKDPEAIIENLPKILASICLPLKRNRFGKLVKLPYMSTPHEEASRDMEEALIEDAYSIAVFFYLVWEAFLQNTGGYLVREMIEAKAKTKTPLSPKERAGLLSILEAYGAGIAARKTSQKSNG